MAHEAPTLMPGLRSASGRGAVGALLAFALVAAACRGAAETTPPPPPTATSTSTIATGYRP